MSKEKGEKRKVEGEGGGKVKRGKKVNTCQKEPGKERRKKVKKEIRVLIVEDSEDDTLLIVREIQGGGYHPIYERVDTFEGMSAALEKQSWDIIISDYLMPRFSGLDALRMLQKSKLHIPFIIVSGCIGEDTAVAAMKAGAQ